MIAVMLINELMDQLVNNVGLKKKVAVFLAPKVDLVVQVSICQIPLCGLSWLQQRPHRQMCNCCVPMHCQCTALLCSTH